MSGEPKRRLRDYSGGKAKSSRVWHVSSFDFVTDFVMGIWIGKGLFVMILSGVKPVS